ncbi:uncharacterized protein LOC123533073 [Mercenaria mercenaria]|uniref:uncharacterized protein LOC123533073 n=1 Tax=Mercenaria mercenaria TaxID=6596 RepID=UPI00234E62D7|nr:uncharacterized protein LOC123533073 [Mercenaria mercenaria]XP_045170626.2 uncharacterized protein LOC123533073 [Mercenaria mercenaria]XP_045170627.2 uncharacterized protein LOC123533073 [Mercenaria mercenaria]
MPSEIKFSILAIICIIVTSSISVAIPYWITADYTLQQGETIHEYVGLWKACANAPGESVCSSFTDVKDFVNATRGLIITGIILFGISLLFAFRIAGEDSRITSANMCIFSLVVGGILLFVAMIVFGTNIDDPKGTISYGSAFYLQIPSAVFAFIAACFVHRSKRSHGYDVIST